MKGGGGATAAAEDEEMQQLRSRATELLLREDWKEYINLYSNFITTTQDPTKLCLALSNRAEARSRLHDLSPALDDCNRALDIDPAHHKPLTIKGKILLSLDRYAEAGDCFQRALTAGSPSALRRLLDRCRRLDAQSRSGALDVTDLAEFVGPVEIRRSGLGGRGLFVIKSVESGAPLVATKAVVIGRGLLPDGGDEPGRMVMWKDFVDRILDAAAKCSRTLRLIYTLSGGDDDSDSAVAAGELDVPDIAQFMPEAEETVTVTEEPDVSRTVRILDVNCLTEQAVAAKVIGKARGYCGVGLWILPAFVNHSCCPNVRRLHVGDRAVVHASRDVKAGEELTFAYFDVLLPLSRREELARRWGFRCRCERCKFEAEAVFGAELRELEAAMIGGGGGGAAEVVVAVEEGMRKWGLKGRREKGFVRASFWAAYESVYASERLMRRWVRRLPAEAMVVESVATAVGADERVLKVVVRKWKSIGGTGESGMREMERVMRMGRGTYGKVVKKEAMRSLFDDLSSSSSSSSY